MKIEYIKLDHITMFKGIFGAGLFTGTATYLFGPAKFNKIPYKFSIPICMGTPILGSYILCSGEIDKSDGVGFGLAIMALGGAFGVYSAGYFVALGPIHLLRAGQRLHARHQKQLADKIIEGIKDKK